MHRDALCYREGGRRKGVDRSDGKERGGDHLSPPLP